MSLEPGRTLSHYRLLSKIGAGGMGEVYLAEDTTLKRKVALKVLPASMTSDPARLERFQREAEAVAALNHPNIVTIYSVERHEAIRFLTMELVEGESLERKVAPGGLALAEVFEIGSSVADALAAAHEKGIVHRDLKPANVMVTRDGRAKVLDFGLAKLTAAGAPDLVTEAETRHASLTGEGMAVGTVPYMSPEQLSGKTVDHRTDIFSLGVMLYELSVGRRPFTGDTSAMITSSILRDAPTQIIEVRQNLPRHLGRIIHRCLEKNPERRYQTAKDVRNELEGLKKEIDSGITPVSESSFTSAATSAAAPTAAMTRRSWLPWAMGAAAVAVIAAAFWAVRQSGTENPAEPATKPGTRATATSTSGASDASDRRRMMVVLPFENLGPAEEAYFAAGVTEEITSRLATISGLGVISRTSATQYDRAGKTMRQIADDLGVDFVVEGTVRWARAGDGKDRVRITPKLIRVADDTQVWTESFDRQIDDIFAVQTEIASQVIDQMGVTLLGTERDKLAEAPTDNMDAYALYLKAKDLKEPNWNEYDRREVEMLEKAVALDPGFLEAWTALSSHHSNWYMVLDKTEARLAKSRVALQKAEAIDPDHPSTLLARGDYFYRGLRDYDQALEQYQTASRLVPNDTRAMESIAYIYRRQGKWDQHLERLEAAFRLDPQSDNIAYNLAETNRALRRFDVAVPLYERTEQLNPQNYRTRFNRAMTMIAWKGNVSAASDILREKPKEKDFWYHLGLMIVHKLNREFPEAMAQARLFDDGSPLLHSFSTSMLASYVARFGVVDPDAPSLEDAARLIEERIEAAPSDDGARTALAHNLALRGQYDAAIREARLAVDLAAKDVFEGPGRLVDLAEVYMRAGRQDEAIDLLERLLKTVYEYPITRELLRLDPDWDPLRENPRFKALLSAGKGS